MAWKRGLAALLLSVPIASRAEEWASEVKEALGTGKLAYQAPRTVLSTRELARMLVAFDSTANADAYAEIPKLDQSQKERLAKKLAESLADWHPEARSKACHALGALGPKPDALPGLTKALEQDDDWHVRAAAAGALSRAGTPTKETALALAAAAAGDEDLRVRAEAAKTLVALGWSSKEPLGEAIALKARIPGLIRRLGRDDEAEVRKAAGELWSIGALAVPALAAAVDKKDSKASLEAAMVLCAIGQEHRSKALAALRAGGVPVLSRALESPFEAVRVLAATELASLGPKAGEAAPVLVKALSDGAKAVRREAYQALMRQQASDQTVLALLKGLEDGMPEPSYAIVVLDARSRPSATILPALIKALSSHSEDVQRGALKILDDMGPGAKDAVPALIGLLGPEHPPGLRREAIAVLGGMGPAAAEAKPALGKLLEDKTPPSKMDPILAQLFHNHTPTSIAECAKDALARIR